MLKTKYYFLKKIYRDCVLIFLKNHSYNVFYEDQILLKGFEKSGMLKKLNEKMVNYIILENLEIKTQVIYENNHYYEYFYKGLLVEQLKKY